jgi:hypothetical protein
LYTIVNGMRLTLSVVAPLSVLSNWEKQVVDHCTTGSLSICVYYNTNRSMSAAQLAKFDVVITTYQTVAGEYADGTRDGPLKKKKKTERTLFDMQWKVSLVRLATTMLSPKICRGLSLTRDIQFATPRQRWQRPFLACMRKGAGS